MSQITFPYPSWTKPIALVLIFAWAPFSFLRKYFFFDLMDVEMATQPICIGLVILFFSQGKVDDERIHYLKFRALAFAILNGLILSWLTTKLLYNWNYSVKNSYTHPISASVFLIITITIAYARLYFLKARN
jgi:hypothetical protein